jgi:hypothetical protein
MRVARRLVMAGLAAAVVVAGSAVVAPAAQASTASSFVADINAARTSHGLRAYATSSELSAVAYGQARRMAAAQKLYHNPGLASQVSSWRYVGENVGYGPDVSTLMTAFMNSAPHRANILDHQYTQVGVGAVTVNGTIWVSMVFREPLYASSPAPAPHATKTTKPATTHHVLRPAANAQRAPKPVHKATPKAPAAAAASDLPPGVPCSAAPVVADRVRGVQDLERDARLLDQTQPLVLGFQCGRSLPMTGVLDRATLAALGV